MRPHLLEFGGIGTYPNHTSIDFDALTTLGLYLIVGPTGAGKSTIFDALTYALYGKVAGERPEGTIVSDHTHRVTPYINLEFSHRNMQYRIERKPPLEGKSPKTNDQVFIESDEAGVEVRRITGATKVTDAVVDIIGLDAKQFMRVILLPQNEFRQFLVANSNEKLVLLRALFGTALYEAIATKLDYNAKEFNTAAKAAETAIETQGTVARNAMTTLQQNGFIHEVPEELNIDEFIAVVRPLAQAALTEAQQALADFQSAVQAEQKAEGEAKRFDAAARRTEVNQAIELNVTIATLAEQVVSNHQRAVPLVSIIKNAQSLADQAATAADAHRDAREQLRAHTKVDGLSTTNLQHVIEDGTLQEIQAKVALTKAELGAYEDTLNRKAQLDETVRTKTAEQEAAGLELTALQAQLSDANALVVQYESDVNEAQKSQIRAVELRVKIKALDEKLAQADVAGAQAHLAVVTESYNKSKKAFDAASEALNTALNERTKHLAGELAAHLKDNEECPVCGSTTHPRKAAPSADSDPKKLQSIRDQAQTEFTQQETLLGQAQVAVEQAQAVADSLPSQSEQNELRQQFDTAQALVDGLATSEAALSACKKDVVSLNERIQNATTTRDTAAKLREEAEVELVEGIHLPSGFTAESLVKEKAILLESERLVAQLVACESKASHTTTAAAEASRAVTSMLKEAGLSSEDEVLSLVLSPEVLAVQSEIVGEQADRIQEVKLLDAQIGSDPLPTSRPDVTSLHSACENKKSISEASSAKATLLDTKLNDLQKVKDDLAKIGPEAEAARVRAREAQKMADVIRKGETGRLSLEKWVQRTLFEEVCDVASEQISTLSSNRYRLTLDGEGQKTGNKSEGLDIFVIDSHNGKTRAVQTLSGGEQFLTSLALALALAEVVQRHSGGIEMSSLFIDEGFGSLDADTLEIAVDVLRSLQNSGRTVGVISHVESMQQELSVGIRVSRSPSGSSLEVLAQKPQ